MTGKGDKQRTVPLLPQTAEALIALGVRTPSDQPTAREMISRKSGSRQVLNVAPRRIGKRANGWVVRLMALV